MCICVHTVLSRSLVKNIYCFGGGCTAHLVPPFESAQVSYLSIQAVFSFNPLFFSLSNPIIWVVISMCIFIILFLFNLWLKIEMLSFGSNPESAFVFPWAGPQVNIPNIWFGFFLKWICQTHHPQAIFEWLIQDGVPPFLFHGGKLIPTLYKDKNSFNTLNKDRNTFRKRTNKNQ